MSRDELRIAVFGSSTIAVPVFDAIAQRHRVVLAAISEAATVRHGKLVPNPVQEWADARSVPVVNGAVLTQDLLSQELDRARLDVLFLLSYGRLLPGNILDLPRLGSINLHPSPLPWYRGAAPIERQIMEGCTRSAVSIIRMSTRLDRGELLAQEAFDILSSDYRADVEASIVRVGTPLALRVIDDLARDAVVPLPSVGNGSYAHKLKPEDELIDWSQSVAAVFNLVRALAPEPAASTFDGTQRVRVTRAQPLPADVPLPSTDAVPGYVAVFDRKRAAVRCGDGWLELFQLQFPGKTPMSTVDLLNGRRLAPGLLFRNTPSS